jgi:hypothetical protein
VNSRGKIVDANGSLAVTFVGVVSLLLHCYLRLGRVVLQGSRDDQRED